MKFEPCPYCRRQMDGTKQSHSTYPTRDHVVPKSRGGYFVVICCRQCNNEKANLPLVGWLGLLKRRNDPRAIHVAAFIDAHPYRIRPVLAPPIKPRQPQAASIIPANVTFDEDQRKLRWSCDDCGRRYRTEAGARLHWRDTHRKEANDNHLCKDHSRQRLA